MRTILFTASLALAAAACSASTTSDPGAGGGGGNGDGSTGGGTTMLSCASHTYCTSYEFISFGGQTLTAPAGGTIADGLYRTGYGARVSSGNDKNLSNVIEISGNQYLRAGFGTNEIGTFTASGSTLSFTPTAECDSERGVVSGTTPHPYTSPYSVDSSGALVLYYANGAAPPTSMEAYLPVKSFCAFPSSPATAPGGDTLQCHVTNCGCAENTNGAADHDTCNFVTGHSG